MQRKVLPAAVKPKSRGQCKSKTLKGERCKNPALVGWACALHMRRIIREINKQFNFTPAQRRKLRQGMPDWGMPGYSNQC